MSVAWNDWVVSEEDPLWQLDFGVAFVFMDELSFCHALFSIAVVRFVLWVRLVCILGSKFVAIFWCLLVWV